MTPDYIGEPRSAGRSMKPRTAFWCALSIWVLTLAATGSPLIFNRLYPLPPGQAAGAGNAANGVAALMFIGGFATVGTLLLHFPQTQAWGHWFGLLFFLSLGFVVFVLLLFPTGSLPSHRWRPVAWAAGAGIAAWVLGNTFAPVSLTSGTPSPIPVGGPAGRIFNVLAGAGVALIAAAGAAAVVSLVFRYRRAQTVEREQLKWLIYAGALIVVAALAVTPIEQIVGPGSSAATNLENAVTTGSVALVPIAIGIAIFRYHLYDIDVVINKTLVYGSLAVFITGVYVAIVVGIGSLAQHGARPSLALSIAATAVVAIAFQPVRAWVQRLANRLVYGRRATPYQVLADFAGRMAGAYAAEDLLPRMARIL